MKKPYLVFNGDADGICAAHQYYLNRPEEYKLVTGLKRDISLLKKISSIKTERIIVFDIAVEQNLPELKTLLQQECRVQWFDHHVSKEFPTHHNVDYQIDTNIAVNTSYLVSHYFQMPSLWSIVGLCGDNVFVTAKSVAKEYQLGPDKFALLKEMGELINYNGYGCSLTDLHIHPAKIMEQMKPFSDPFAFLQNTPVIATLKKGLVGDLLHADKAYELEEGVFEFPNEKWARRVVGIFANRKANQAPDKPHAMLVAKDDKKSFMVSVRSPVDSQISAVDLCKRFPTGGGRVKAAGINELPYDQVPNFITNFKLHYQL